MTDVGRLANLLDRAAETMLHVDLPRVSPLAVPVLTLIGREQVATGVADDALLIEAEALAAEAMRAGLISLGSVPTRSIALLATEGAASCARRSFVLLLPRPPAAAEAPPVSTTTAPAPMPSRPHGR